MHVSTDSAEDFMECDANADIKQTTRVAADYEESATETNNCNRQCRVSTDSAEL
jgi:hypothetical protein